MTNRPTILCIVAAATAVLPGLCLAEKVADRPRGPAELRVRYFGLDEAVNRAGLDSRLVCKLENTGGRPARDLIPQLSLNRAAA